MKATKVTVDKNGLVHIICVLDRSGSMSGMESDVIGGFNAFVKAQQKVGDNAVLTLILFDSQYEVVFKRVPISQVPVLDNKIYNVRGMTALMDALGFALTTFTDDLAIVFVNTDGHENSSKEFTDQQIRDLVTNKKNLGWDFQFVGAGIDAWAVGSQYGFSKMDTISVSNTSAGYVATYDSMNLRSTKYRSSVGGCE